jgi:hypothetical protein
MSIEVQDLRKGVRFLAVAPLAGTYGASEVTVINISLGGAQLMHAQPLRIGTRAKLWFQTGDVVCTTQALVLWSHLSQHANESGKFMYTSGMQIEAPEPSYAASLNALFTRGMIRKDTNSLENKRQRLLERERERARVTMKANLFSGGVPKSNPEG